MPLISLGPDGITVDMGVGEAVTVIDGNGCECTFVSEAYTGADDSVEPTMSLTEMAAYFNEPNDILNDTEFASVDGDYGTTDGSVYRETVSTEVPREKVPEMFAKSLGAKADDYPFEAARTYMAFVEDALERISAELRGAFYEMTFDERRNAARVIENGRALVFVEIGEKAD